jgi:hypothetical protein
MFKKIAIIGSLINTENSPILFFFLQENTNALSIVETLKSKELLISTTHIE